MSEKKRKVENMDVRTISALIGIAVCCVAIFIAPNWIGVLLFSLVSGLMAYEFTVKTGLVDSKAKAGVSVFFATILPWLFYCNTDLSVLVFAVFIFICVIFVISIFERRSDINDLSNCLFGGFFLPCVLSLIVPFLDMKNGKLLLIIPFVSSWMADCFAYITGSLLGKHKLLPLISPKKTVEGALGGLVGGIIGMLIYGGILTLFDYKINFLLFIVIGLLGAIFGLLGDLSLSYIKRKCFIKDFGNLIPGHGGVLDRFDSTLFVIPICVFIFRNAVLIY